ncbi:unnamed protein product [Victoria cruziana]
MVDVGGSQSQEQENCKNGDGHQEEHQRRGRQRRQHERQQHQRGRQAQQYHKGTGAEISKHPRLLILHHRPPLPPRRRYHLLHLLLPRFTAAIVSRVLGSPQPPPSIDRRTDRPAAFLPPVAGAPIAERDPFMPRGFGNLTPGSNPRVTPVQDGGLPTCGRETSGKIIKRNEEAFPSSAYHFIGR